jgi:protein ImuB
VPALAWVSQQMQGELGLVSAPAELWIALHLPALVVESVAPSPPGTAAGSGGEAEGRRPLAVFDGAAALPRLVAVDAAARERGVVPGLSLPAALALEPALDARPREPRRERARLARLADAALGFTPRVSLEPPDGLLLEVRGSLGLFGGAAALCEAVAACCARLGSVVQLALAPTPLAALALARAGRPLVLAGPERLAGALAPLPLAVLRWPDSALLRLAAMGVRTLGAAQRLPRAGFARRFGRIALEDLDRLVGRRPDPRRPWQPRTAFRGRCEPSFELEQHEAILRHLEPLLADLERFLRSRQSAVLRLRLVLRHRAGPFDGRPRTTSLELGLAAPEFEAARFGALFAEHLARLVLPAPVVAFELRSGELQARVARSESLWRPGEHGGAAGRESPALIERLRARLGPGAVYGLCLVDEHRPEHAWRAAEPGMERASVVAGREPAGVHRPLWLLRPPQPLGQGPPRALRLLDGPERIESGWWDGHDVTRDYYTARDAGGALLWVFRERRPPHRWFLHGVFG